MPPTLEPPTPNPQPTPVAHRPSPSRPAWLGCNSATAITLLPRCEQDPGPTHARRHGALIGPEAGGQASTPRKCFRSDTAPSNRRTVESSNRCHCEAVANACNVGPESPNPEPLPSHTAHPSCKIPMPWMPVPAPRTETAQNSGLGFGFGLGLGLVWDTCALPRDCGLKLVFCTHGSHGRIHSTSAYHRPFPLHPIKHAPSVPFHLMPALKSQSPPRVPDRSRREEKQTNPGDPRSTPHAARSSPGLGPHWRDLGSAFGGIPGRLCRLAAVRATGTRGRRRGPTTGPWPLASSPTHAAPSLAWMAWVAWEVYRLLLCYGRFLARAWPITQRFPRALRLASLLSGPIGVVCRAANLVPFPFPRTFDARLGPFATPHTTKLAVASPWSWVARATKQQHHARPVGTAVRMPAQHTVAPHSQLRESTDFVVA